MEKFIIIWEFSQLCYEVGWIVIVAMCLFYGELGARTRIRLGV